MVDIYKYPLDITKRSYLEFNAWDYDLGKISEEVGFKLSTINPSSGGAGAEQANISQQTREGNENAGATTQNTDVNRKDKLWTVKTYIPGGFGESMNSTWNSEAVAHVGSAEEAVASLSGAGTTLVEGAEGSKSSTDLLQTLKNAGGQVGDIARGIAVFTVATKGVELAGRARSTIEASLGKRLDPSKSLVYQGSDHRNLSLNYKFSPRNAQEGRQMLHIINSFQNAMVPVIDSDDPINNILKGLMIAYSYPPIFNIRVVFNGDAPTTLRSDGFFEFRAMALTGFDVKYAEGNEIYTYFQDGIPTTASMSLTFKSLFPAYRDSKTNRLTASLGENNNNATQIASNTNTNTTTNPPGISQQTTLEDGVEVPV